MSIQSTCVFSPSQVRIIEIVVDGRGRYGGETLADLRANGYSDAEEISIDEAVARVEAKWITEPVKITDGVFLEALSVLPPMDWVRMESEESFKMCEMLSGRITGIYCRLGDEYFVMNDRCTLSHQEIVERCKKAEAWK